MGAESPIRRRAQAKLALEASELLRYTIAAASTSAEPSSALHYMSSTWGRPPWPADSSRSAVQRRGGGIIFGPVVRSHAHKLQKKVRRLGLMCALSVSCKPRTCFSEDC